MSRDASFLGFLSRIRGQDPLTPADAHAISSLPETPRSRTESQISRRSKEPSTAEDMIREEGIPQFEDSDSGFAHMGWKEIPSGGPVIAGGRFANVKLAYKLEERGKRLECRHLCLAKVQSQQEFREVRTELHVLQSCVHVNIVDLFGVFYDRKEKEWYILLEYASAGDMQKEIDRFGDQFMPESGAKYYLHQVCRGLQYLHSKFIKHNDLHTRNVLLTYRRDGRKKCLICDFGISLILDPSLVQPADNTWQEDLAQVCLMALYMMTQGKTRPKKIQTLSPEAQQVLECINVEAPATVQLLLAFPFFQERGSPPQPPVPPSPILKPRLVSKMGFLPPAARSSRPAPAAEPAPSSQVTGRSEQSTGSHEAIAERAAEHAVASGLDEVRNRQTSFGRRFRSLGQSVSRAVNCFRPPAPHDDHPDEDGNRSRRRSPN